MHKYSRDLTPPAPILTTEVSHPIKHSQKSKLKLILDSGAGMTCIPEDLIGNIKVYHRGSIDVEAYDGTVTEKNTGFFRIMVNGKEFILESILIEGEYGLLGRDILNQVITALDGPKETFDIC